MVFIKSQYVNTIIKSVFEVCNSFFPNKVSRGNPIYEDGVKQSSVLIISIAFAGDISGQYLLLYDKDIVKEVVNAMTKGYGIKNVVGLEKSGASEFSNMIAGHVTTNFREIGKKIHISPPIRIEGDVVITSDNSFLGIPFEINQKKFTVYMLYKEEEL